MLSVPVSQPEMSNPNPRRFLSADGLIKTLRFRFKQIPDARRQSSVVHRLPDVLMAAFAMFSLKDPSLLAFQDRIHDGAIKLLYRLDAVPSDSIVLNWQELATKKPASPR
jgi:hypothetical protein